MTLTKFFRPLLAAATLTGLAACGGGGSGGGEGTPPPIDPDEVRKLETVSQILSRGGRQLSGEEIRAELVGKTLESGPGGWTWVISADGTSVSEGIQSVWYLADDAYCRARPGDANYGCSKVYELAGIYRFTSRSFADLAGWSVTAGAPVGGAGMPPPNQDAAARARMDVGELLSSGETLTARHVSGVEFTQAGDSNESMAMNDWRHFHLRRNAGGELQTS